MTAVSRAALIGAMLGAAMNLAPVPGQLAIRNRPEAPQINLDRWLPKMLHIGGEQTKPHRKTRRYRISVAEGKRRAIKARNIRRQRLAMKRRGRA